MTLQNVFRYVVMFIAAIALGWWARGFNTAVHAQRTSQNFQGSGHTAADLGFQFGGTGRDSSLTLYVPDTHTFYVYPTDPGSTHINCEYTLHFDRPGAPLQKQNCAMSSAY